MNTAPGDPAPRRPGIIDAIKNAIASALGSTRTRIDTFSAEVEHRVFRLVSMIIWTLVALVCLSLGLLFAMLTVIFGFDLPPRYALGIPALVFLMVGLVAVVMVRHAKRRRT